MNFGNSRRILIVIVLLLSLFVAVAIPLYLNFGEQLVRDIYAGKSFGLLNSTNLPAGPLSGRALPGICGVIFLAAHHRIPA